MKYVEQQGKEPFNWGEFLNKKEFTKWELLNAYDLSVTWVTCACGNQCREIPRGDNGAPKDFKLWQLGDLFATAIGDMHRAKKDKNVLEVSRQSAVKILSDIEARSLQIINNLKKK
jgi:hypothetical protein